MPGGVHSGPIWTDSALKGYDILYGPTRREPSSTAVMLTVKRPCGTEMTNASVPPGTWTFSYPGSRHPPHQLGPVSSLELTVTNTNDTISQVSEQPDWLAESFEFVQHYTGCLVPLSSFPAYYYAPASSPSAPTLSSVSGGSLGAATYYVKVTLLDSTGETPPSSESSLAVAAGNLLQVTSPIGSGALTTSWNVYVSTSSGTEVLQNATPIPLTENWAEPTSGLITGVSPPTLNTTGWQVFDEFVPDPFESANYITATVDTGYNANLRVFSSITTALGPGQTGSPAQVSFEIDTWLTGQSDPFTFTPWTIGFVEMRYLRSQLLYEPITAGNVSYIKAFTVTVDTAPLIENNSSGGISVIATVSTTGTLNGTTTVSSISSMTGIAAGQAITGNNIPAGTTVATVNIPGSSLTMSAAATGSGSESISFNTWVTFPTQYHSDPNVVVTPVSSSAASASATNITTTGFSPIIWNSSGTSIAGVANWQSTGA